jgi:hypothetical protein
LREIVTPDDFNTVSPSQLKRDRARELVALLAWIIHDFASKKRKGALKD